MPQRKIHSVNKALTEDERVRHRAIREQVEQEKAALIAHGRRAVAPHATVIRRTCKHNGGPDILLLVRSPTLPGGQSWTPPQHSARTWRVPPEAKAARATLVFTRARTGDSSAPSAARRSAPVKAQRFTGCALRLRRSPWW